MKKTKRASSQKASGPSKKHKSDTLQKDWIMPFNAAFPGQDEVDFILESEDEDSAIIFQFESDSEEDS